MEPRPYGEGLRGALATLQVNAPAHETTQGKRTRCASRTKQLSQGGIQKLKFWDKTPICCPGWALDPNMCTTTVKAPRERSTQLFNTVLGVPFGHTC